MTNNGAVFWKNLTHTGLVVSSIFLGSAMSANAQEQGWALTQRSTQMGDLYTYVSPNGLKWTVPKIGANIATQGPGWNVSMYNDKTKSYYTTTFQQWQQTIMRKDQRSLEMRQRPWSKAGSGNVAGLKATKYIMQNSAPVAGRRSLNAVAAAECWVADDITVPAAVADMLANTYGMPKTKYFPLRISYTGTDGKPGIALDTYRAEARAMPANAFAFPQGYKLVASQAEVFMDDETQQMMNDMASEMGLDAPRRPQQRPAMTTQAAPRGMGVRHDAQPAQGNNDLSKMLDALKGGK
ncbi:hypothetical protein KF913_01840 [Candidatus Obscuribacterales bacterium]|nr:hypothetical protein [Candidatus Obscuribacterales bacterium]